MTESHAVRAKGLLLGLVVLALFCAVGGGIWVGARGAWAVPFVVFFALSVFLMPVFLRLLRCPSRVVLAGLGVLVVVMLVSVFTAPSAWLTVAGERTECTVTGLRQSDTRSGADYYHHDLRCGEQATEYTDRHDFLAETGERLPMVVDRAGLIDADRPGSVVAWKSGLFVLDVLLALGLVIAVFRTAGRVPPRVRAAAQPQ
ncbi:hypothetical protein [Saccharothrix variisporea]|uniref:Uncharacterized protein n=1 Tax=Saccharothrix variisporea TaxID=543527 RepID=A0A495XHA0_9PSEU|nr:hypothetical protein [Saccharothrix variisporea]RKT72475.1 hypothetical protein DFJ66_5789 [Saccharothrix variisporea]